jgi:hypothetical protein
MSDPTRLGDPRSKSPPALRRLIEAGRSDIPDTERLLSLGNRLGFGAGPVPGAGPAHGAAAGLGGGAAKIGTVVVLVIGAGAGVLATSNLATAPPTVIRAPSATSNQAPSSRQRRVDPQIAALAPSSGEESLEQTPLPASLSIARGTSSVAAATATPAGTRPKDGTVATTSPAPFMPPSVTTGGSGFLAPQPDSPPAESEFSLLEQAQRALRGDPLRALDLTGRDARQYPSGTLAQEREVIAIEALVQLGRSDEASARANHFFRNFPGSAHGPRIAALLGFDAGVHNP